MSRRLLALPAAAALTLSGALELTMRRAERCPAAWHRWAWLWCREQARRMNRDFRTDLYEADPSMLWHMRSGGALGALTANSLGLLGPEPRSEPPADGRWLFLTSSGAIFGARPYPFLLGDVLQAGGLDVEISNGGMHGATSAQGLVLARRLLPALRPSVVFMSYLWNDHWRSSVVSDVDMMLMVQGSEKGRTDGHAHWREKSVRRLRRFSVQARHTPPRVPPRAYRDNHRALVALVREHGAQPVFLDLPGNQERFVHPGYLKRGFAASAAEFRKGHARHSAWLRKLARELGVIHIDLEPAFAAHPNRDLLFDSDHIHWSSRGVNLGVRALVSQLTERSFIAAELAERCLANWRPTSLCPDDLRAEIRLAPLPKCAAPGGEIALETNLTNRGNTIWCAETPKAMGQVRLALDLWHAVADSDTPPIVAARVDLPHDIAPGESVSLRIRLKLPDSAGPHTLRIDLVSELVTFFHSHAGTPPIEHQFTLAGP